MIINSSALLAIVQDEPEADIVLAAAADASCRMSVATWLEVCIVADARSSAHGERLDRILQTLEVVLEPVSEHQARIARHAYRRYGRGSGSAARLTYGDCFAYALTVVTGEPLLFVGDDFTHTDVARALPAGGIPT